MSVRFLHRGARLVLVVHRVHRVHRAVRADRADRADEAVSEQWLALHLSRPPWAEVLPSALDILDLGGRPDVDLRWTGRRYWTTIDLRLTAGSPRTRQLIAASLLRSARYLLV